MNKTLKYTEIIQLYQLETSKFKMQKITKTIDATPTFSCSEYLTLPE